MSYDEVSYDNKKHGSFVFATIKLIGLFSALCNLSQKFNEEKQAPYKINQDRFLCTICEAIRLFITGEVDGLLF